MRAAWFLLAVACGVGGGGASAGDCPLGAGTPFGPCGDGQCAEGYCVQSLGGGSVCAVPCVSWKCAGSCVEPEGHSCDPSGSCLGQCGHDDGTPDDSLCLPGQFCDKAGDDAPWECFWTSP